MEEVAPTQSIMLPGGGRVVSGTRGHIPWVLEGGRDAREPFPGP